MNLTPSLLAFILEIITLSLCVWGLFTVLLKKPTQESLTTALPSGQKFLIYGCIVLIAALSHQLLKIPLSVTLAPSSFLSAIIPPLATTIASVCLLIAVIKLRASALEENTKNPGEQQWETLQYRAFKNNAAPLLITDTQQKIILTNKAAALFLRQHEEALKELSLGRLVERSDIGRLRDLFPNTISQKRADYSVEVRLKSEESDTLWVKILPSVIELDEDNLGLVLFLQDISEQKSLAELIAFHAHYDELTMLHNREGLERYLEKALQINRSSEGQIALLYFDVDQLKVINDTCGHAAGDRLLQYLITEVGQASQHCQFFARVGGDEFALVKLNSSKEEALSLAESIRGAAEDFTFFWKDSAYRQSISVGVALSSEETDNIIDLIGAADSACGSAKAKGRNRVVMASDTAAIDDSARGDMLWVSRLQKAIQDGNFELYFQPIDKTLKGEKRHVHYELLIRYVDENGQHILPDQFLPAVERFGLSEQVDLWVLTTALDFLDRHPAHTEMLNCCSINLTTQSIANPRIRSAILQVLEGYNFPREKLCFEITETSAIQNLAEAKEFINDLKKLGCHMALDDFGTGFSSFGYLKHLPVDYLKIDGSFVKDILTDNFDRAMVSAMTNIGKELNIAVIAEYAENQRILNVLQEMDVDFAQGFGISEPMPINVLEAYYL